MNNIDISKIWPDWTITEHIGHGGYGNVYKAISADIGAVSAVKVISVPINPDDIAKHRRYGKTDDEICDIVRKQADRLIGEIRVMQKLKGITNIVSIEDSALREKEDSIGYDIYIRMEFLTPMTQHIAEIFPLTDEDVVKIGCDICTALEICHKETPNKRVIIHRDIKPENILYHELSDAYKLGDFGIARELSDTVSFMTSIGTPRFCAPEVEAATVYDHRTDLYSLGLVLYFLRNRERMPFENLEQPVDNTEITHAKWIRLHNEKPIPAPVDASPALAKVILKACAYNPEDRYASAADMKEALQKALAPSQEIVSQDVGASSPVRANTTTKREKGPFSKLIPLPIISELMDDLLFP